MTPEDLDQAVEQFHAALDDTGYCVAAGDIDGELFEVGPGAVVKALLAAGWRPPEVVEEATIAAEPAPAGYMMRYELHRDSDDALMAYQHVPIGHGFSWRPPLGFDPRYPSGYHWRGGGGAGWRPPEVTE